MPRLVMPKPPGGAGHPPASETLQANTEAEMSLALWRAIIQFNTPPQSASIVF